jgi:hypothetical protein
MRPLIETSEWLFSAVKASTLILAWLLMVKHAKVNLEFVHKAAIGGSVAYMLIWSSWFFSAM